MRTGIVLLTCQMSERKGRWKSDFQAHMRAAAAAELFNLYGVDTKIIVTGGKINGPNTPALADVLSDELERVYRIPEESIIRENKSRDTDENAKYSAEIIREYGLDHILLDTTSLHMDRASDCFRREGLDVKECCAEDVLGDISSRHLRLVKEWKSSPEYYKMLVRDKAVAFVTRYEIGKKIIKYLVSRGRS